jgi:hypothetical protein
MHLQFPPNTLRISSLLILARLILAGSLPLLRGSVSDNAERLLTAIGRRNRWIGVCTRVEPQRSTVQAWPANK